MENPQTPPRICSKSSCKNVLPIGSTYSSCQRCRERNRAGEAERRKRKRSEVTAPPPRQAPIIRESGKAGGSSQREPVLAESSDEDKRQQPGSEYQDSQQLFDAIRKAVNEEHLVDFLGRRSGK